MSTFHIRSEIAVTRTLCGEPAKESNSVSKAIVLAGGPESAVWLSESFCKQCRRIAKTTDSRFEEYPSSQTVAWWIRRAAKEA